MSGKPKKKDFTDMREFLRAAAAWAEANMNEWPWGGAKDEDDQYYFVVTQKSAPAFKATQNSAESGPLVTQGWAGADT